MRYQLEQRRNSGKWVFIEQFNDKKEADSAARKLAAYARLATRVRELRTVSTFDPS